MDITPLIPQNSKVVQNYGPQGFQISGELFQTSIYLFPQRVKPSEIQTMEALKLHHFQFDDPIYDDLTTPEVILLGTGKTMKLLPFDLKRQLDSASIVVDAMDTGAACRTYNALLAEGRLVCALLLPYTDAV